MQERFLNSSAKRIVIRAGRRGGKTTGMGIKAVTEFCKGRRVLYAAPTEDQIAQRQQTICNLLGYTTTHEKAQKLRSELYKLARELDTLTNPTP